MASIAVCRVKTARWRLVLLLSVCCWTLAGWTGAVAQDAPTESDYYPMTSFGIPDEVVLEASGFQMLADGRLAIASRRGEIWIVSDPHSETVTAEQFTRFAHGLHEALSLAEKDGWLYVVQRSDVSRLRDTNDDGVADEFQVVCDAWGLTGDYHEYAFGSKFDKAGNMWVTLCLTGSFTSDAPYRGWCVRIGRDGRMIPTTSGIRSPGGVGSNLKGDLFYTDNQGPWNGTCGLKQLIPGKFVGHPGGLEWYSKAAEVMGPKPQEPRSGGRMIEEAKRIPQLEPTSIWFPYSKMGKSASGIACDTTEGKFGPFAGQLFVADQSDSTVMRCFLEKVQGHYQGACFPFRSGFSSGNLPVEFSKVGSMFVGGTNRGWGSVGVSPFAVERLDWSGRVPFEVHEMRLREDGFELTFTEPVDEPTAISTASYELSTYTYIYHSTYGSPEVDKTSPTITSAIVANDKKSLRLVVEGLQVGHVHELHLPGLRSESGLGLLHPVAYYTLNYLRTSHR